MDKRIGFVVRIKQLFGKVIAVDEVGMESYLFEHSEIDSSIVPSEHLLLLPDPVQFDTFVYVEEGEEEGRNGWLEWAMIRLPIGWSMRYGCVMEERLPTNYTTKRNHDEDRLRMTTLSVCKKM